MIEKMKKHYNFHEADGKTLFELPNDTIMRIDTFYRKTESSLIMDYTSPGDNDDGDQFYPIDFSSPDEMFEAMLEETKL